MKDMTIEEALIKSEFGMTYTDEEHDQIIKWLKELKYYQLGDCMNDCEHYDNCSNYIYSKGYNKAIDDLAEKIADWCDFCNGGMRKECVKGDKCKIYEMAEQLKC